MTTNDTIHISELLAFYYDTCEDFHLWDETELGPYPIDRILTALKNFINTKDHEQDNLR
jgi:hypothetical protein